MSDTVLAAQLYTVRDFLKTPQEIQSSLEKVRGIGYEAVQLSALGPIEPRALREIADELGLRIVATHVDYERICSDVRSVIDEHEIWSCKNVAIGSMPQSYRDRDGFARFARDASAAAAPLIEAGESITAPAWRSCSKRVIPTKFSPNWTPTGFSMAEPTRLPGFASWLVV